MTTRTFALLLIPLIVLLVSFAPIRNYLFPGKYIYTEIEIDAPIGEVWQVLANIERYPEWNPYHVQVDGKLMVGAPLVVHVEKPNGESLRVHPRMIHIRPREELTWGGGIPVIFQGEHRFLLESTPGGGTKLVHQEAFTGMAVRFVPLDAIEEGYLLMNQALKTTVEAKTEKTGEANVGKTGESNANQLTRQDINP